MESIHRRFYKGASGGAYYSNRDCSEPLRRLDRAGGSANEQ